VASGEGWSSIGESAEPDPAPRTMGAFGRPCTHRLTRALRLGPLIAALGATGPQCLGRSTPGTGDGQTLSLVP